MSGKTPGQFKIPLASSHVVKEALPKAGRYFDTHVKLRQETCRAFQEARSVHTVS